MVDKEGRVSSIHVVRDLASLTSPTVGAVRQWKFAPGKHEGEAIESGVIVVVTFRRPVVASRGLHSGGSNGSCGVSMKGRCLFRQGVRLAGAGLNKSN
ncbi:MAG TPA: energy transducer TonB, partial [Candidatus Acidoferrum sp.]